MSASPVMLFYFFLSLLAILFFGVFLFSVVTGRTYLGEVDEVLWLGGISLVSTLRSTSQQSLFVV